MNNWGQLFLQSASTFSRLLPDATNHVDVSHCVDFAGCELCRSACRPDQDSFFMQSIQGIQRVSFSKAAQPDCRHGNAHWN